MGIFANILLSPAKKEMNRYIDFLTVGGNEEIGMILASASVARKIAIDNMSSLRIILDGNRPFIYHEGNEVLSQGYIDISRIQRDIYNAAKTNPSISYITAGMAVWKMTLMSVTAKPGDQLDTDLYVYGKKMWRELSRGIPYVEQALEELRDYGGVALEDWHFENAKYIPEMYQII